MPTDSGIFRDDTNTPVGGRIIRAYRRDTGALIGSALSSDGLATPGDPYLSDRVLLIRGDGSSIVDECPSPRTITSGGNAGLVTDAAAFGGKAIYLDGSGDSLKLDGNSALAFGTASFAVEMRIRPLSVSNDMALIDFRPLTTNGNYLTISLKPSGDINVYVNSAERIVGPHGFNTTAYHHVAYCRSGGVGRLFADGQLVGSWSDSTNYGVGANRPIVGALGFSESLTNANMFVQSIRVSLREEYTSAFTPPAQQFYANAPAAATPIGSYSITHSHTGERQFVFLDDAGGTTYNDKIARVV